MSPSTAPTITIPAELRGQIDLACERIAPTWPLDQFIAVNPYWGWRSSPIGAAAARLGVLAGTALTMPRSWFREEYRAGRLATHHLTAAAQAAGDVRLAELALALLDDRDEPAETSLRRMALVTDIRDLGDGPVRGRSWTDHVVHQIGQHCAARFDDWQATWAPGHSRALFSSWRTDPSIAHGVEWHHGRAWVTERLAALPDDPTAAIAAMLDELGIERAHREAYLTALLLSVNGWAAWCAQLRWQARLADGDDDSIVEFLALRLAWDWLLALDLDDDPIERDRLDQWAASWGMVDELTDSTEDDQRLDWVLQLAVERTYQESVAAGFPTAGRAVHEPEVQAVFCIDVRSEVFRRALEASSGRVATRGFAGFFGLPISYTPVGSALTRPQLPGLLAPAIDTTDTAAGIDIPAVAATRSRALSERNRWQSFRTEPSSMFSYVESLGLLSTVKLVKDSLPHHHEPEPWERDGLGAEHAALRPRLAIVDDDPTGAAAIGKKVLTAMGLLDDFAPVVLLCGHGSQSANNPHAAGLDCGACGGQTGEVNARVLADLLNDPAVRRELAVIGITIPHTTWFLPALHVTTTDVIRLLDTALVPGTHREPIDRLVTLLEQAGQRARAERAGSLGLGGIAHDPRLLAERIEERANDWSQVRPEWGLAGNAAFVVAPRSRTAHLDLGGRSFLHDYDWRLDPDLSVLTLIMTAPMVVTNWINLQYHASTVDNRRYGSGDKVLHNVVGGRIGVFEGNGGDLRIGLAMQSLHDGDALQHPPLRLSVFIEAPRDSIESVYRAHTVVQELLDGAWLHLLRIDPADGAVERWTGGGWVAI